MMTSEEINNFIPTITIPACKYLWYHCEKVGDTFFIPRTDLKSEDYRPPVPEKLRARSWAFKIEKGTSNGVMGLRVKRIN